jgi:hypothetical protein
VSAKPRQRRLGTGISAETGATMLVVVIATVVFYFWQVDSQGRHAATILRDPVKIDARIVNIKKGKQSSIRYTYTPSGSEQSIMHEDWNISSTTIENATDKDAIAIYYSRQYPELSAIEPHAAALTAEAWKNAGIILLALSIVAALAIQIHRRWIDLLR